MFIIKKKGEQMYYRGYIKVIADKIIVENLWTLDYDFATRFTRYDLAFKIVEILEEGKIHTVVQEVMQNV